MTTETAEIPAVAESSWVEAVADEPNELGQAILAQGERLYEATVRANATRDRKDEETDKRLDDVEKGGVARDEKLVAIKDQLTDIKDRLDRPSGAERALEAMAAGAGKLLDNKPAVVLAVLLLAGLAGVVIDTPWGKVGAGSGDDDTAAPLAQDDDDGGGDTEDGGTENGDSDAIAFPR
jgi:hypothetical protein